MVESRTFPEDSFTYEEKMGLVIDSNNYFEQVPKGKSIIREAAKKAVDKFFQDNPDLVPGHIFEKGERWDNTSTTFQGGTEVTIGGVNKDSLIALRDHINEVLSQMQ